MELDYPATIPFAWDDTDRQDIVLYYDRYYGYRAVEDLFDPYGVELRALGFRQIEGEGEGNFNRSATWKRTDKGSCIVAYVTRDSLQLRYVDARLEAVSYPMNQETARLLLSGRSNSQLMAMEHN